MVSPGSAEANPLFILAKGEGADPVLASFPVVETYQVVVVPTPVDVWGDPFFAQAITPRQIKNMIFFLYMLVVLLLLRTNAYFIVYDPRVSVYIRFTLNVSQNHPRLLRGRSHPDMQIR